jgi:hypothetical protein
MDKLEGLLSLEYVTLSDLSGGKVTETLRVCESVLPMWVDGDVGRPKSNEGSGWLVSVSSEGGSTTGSVIVSRNTGILATSPNILSKKLLLFQLVKVGKRVARST